MMAIALSLLTSKAGLIGLAVIAAGISILIWRRRIRRAARAEAVAEMKAATEAESDRRQAVLEQAQAAAQQRAADLANTERHNVEALRAVERESAAHDDEPALSADAVDRLRRLGRD